MAKRKLEGTVYLFPAKVESLGRLRKLLQMRHEHYSTSHPRQIDALNNIIVDAYRNCKERGLTEKDVQINISGLKEARF